jgi:hypothetical protein
MQPAFRGLIWSLITIIIALLLIALALPKLVASPPGGPVPTAPEISAPQGEIPSGAVSFQEWARYQDGEYELVGCGFIFRYDPAGVVAATTAHSVDLRARVLEAIAFGLPDMAGLIFESKGFHGAPGRPRAFGLDMRVDYLLLEPPDWIHESQILVADPRGVPQPGEKVMLLTCGRRGVGSSGSWGGNVLEVSQSVIWIAMHDQFNPAEMSGSPIISAHTGEAVGMAVAASQQPGRLLIGAHPIGSLVQKARQGRDSSIRMSEFRR